MADTSTTQPQKSQPVRRRTSPLWNVTTTPSIVGVMASRVIITIAVLAAWELLAVNGVFPEHRYGSPSGIVESLVDLYQGGELWEHTWATIQATLAGFAIGSFGGVVLGLLLGFSPYLDRVFMPLVSILNSMPRIAFAPLLVVWFGLAIWSKVWMGASLCIFIMLLNTRAGSRSVSHDHRVLATVLQMGRLRFFTRIVMPAALPSMFAGLRLSVVYALLGVIASEMIVAINGLGTLVVKYSSSTLDVDAVFGILVVIALIAAVFAAALERIERQLLHWQN